MESSRLVAYFGRELAAARARLAAKIAGEPLDIDLDHTLVDPLWFFGQRYTERCAEALAIRNSIKVLAEAVRYEFFLKLNERHPKPAKALLDDLLPHSPLARLRRFWALLRGEESAEGHALALARERAHLAAKQVDGDRDRVLRDPFRYLSERAGQAGAVSFVLRLRVRSVADSLAIFSTLVTYVECKPALEDSLDKLLAAAEGADEPRALAAWAGDERLAALAIELARTKARLGAKLTGEDIDGMIGEPFRFIKDQLGERGAVAYCLRTSAESISLSLLSAACAFKYKVSPPTFREIMQIAEAVEREDDDQALLLTDKIQ